jgi:hypothetical protein
MTGNVMSQYRSLRGRGVGGHYFLANAFGYSQFVISGAADAAWVVKTFPGHLIISLGDRQEASLYHRRDILRKM